MTADIIQFGKPQSRSVKAKKRGHQATEAAVLPDWLYEQCAEIARREGRTPQRWEPNRKIEPVTVRCMHEGKIYEVRFIGDDPDKISHLCHRTQNGRTVEMRYRVWGKR